MNVHTAVLLLGRRDTPTDGVADYCEKLRDAGAARGFSFEIVAVPWADKGWREALAELRQSAEAWRNCWVFLQYTTLAWSMRGFPLRVPGVLSVLKEVGARPAIVFHDFMPVRGHGVFGLARTLVQSRALSQLQARSNLSVFTVPVEKIAWLPQRHDNAVFIPVGSNFSAAAPGPQNDDAVAPAVFTVAVFGITDGLRGSQEVGDITHALRSVQSQGIRVRLIGLGRGSEAFERELRQALAGSGVELAVLGLMPAEDLVRVLAAAQALLCVRGHVSSRRGSAIAGIVCGVPIVGYRGEETGFPITEAGVKLVEIGDREGLAKALAQVLSDQELHGELRERSFQAAQKYFSWDAIASQFLQAMAAR